MPKQNPKFEPLAGNDYKITPNFDSLSSGKGQYGDYWFLGITEADVKKTWFMTEPTAKMMERAKWGKGDELILSVSQQKGEKGLYNTYSVIDVAGARHYSHGQPQGDSDTPPPPSDSDAPPQSENAKPKPPPDAYKIMERCVDHACDLIIAAQARMTKAECDIKFTGEDVRTLAISMFIHLSNGRK